MNTVNKIKLSEKDVRELVSENRYKVDPKKKYFSRCIDGRYKNDDGLAAQAFPGADLGELALILATARSYGLEIDMDKAYTSLIDVIGSEKDFTFHTDSHGDPEALASGCGHFKQINLDPQAYKLEPSDIDFMKSKLTYVKSKGADQVVLGGEHMEGAILLVKGDGWGIYPQYNLETERGNKFVEVFVYHQTLTDEKHRVLAEKLLDSGAVKFKLGEDREYLYEILSETAENHLMETAKRLASDLPIYTVTFDIDGSFKIKTT